MSEQIIIIILCFNGQVMMKKNMIVQKTQKALPYSLCKQFSIVGYQLIDYNIL